MITANDINTCSDHELLLAACVGARGDFTASSGHWGDPIIALPWQLWREYLRWYLQNEYFPEWPYRVCNLDISADPVTDAEVVAAQLLIAANRLGASLSLTRGGSETLIAWARRGLCAKLAGETS